MGNDRGMTLVEVLVAVTLLGICAMTFLPMLTQAAYSSQHSRYVTIASAVASGTMEEVLAGYMDLAAAAKPAGQELPPTAAQPTFRRHLHVTNDSSGCKVVTVTVSWGEGPKAQSIKMTSLVNR